MSRKDHEGDAAEQRRKRMSIALWTSFAVVIVIGFIILAKLASGGSSSSSDVESTIAPDSLIKKLTSVPASVYAAVGQGSATKLPQSIKAPALTKDGKPHVFYMGAEYCPYCATERWPMVVALLRFGTFKDLRTSHSATQDAYPNTQTFSFHDSSYSSQYLSFTGIETSSNQVQGTSYAPLDTPTAEENDLMKTYNAPPYVSAQSAGSIPFIDFGGQFLISGSTYDPGVLANKSQDEIATALSDPKSDVSKGVVGAANTITAALCKLTNNQPANVCSTPVITDLQGKLGS